MAIAHDYRITNFLTYSTCFVLLGISLKAAGFEIADSDFILVYLFIPTFGIPIFSWLILRHISAKWDEKIREWHLLIFCSISILLSIILILLSIILNVFR